MKNSKKNKYLWGNEKFKQKANILNISSSYNLQI